jgi:hypothetical protein
MKENRAGKFFNEEPVGEVQPAADQEETIKKERVALYSRTVIDNPNRTAITSLSRIIMRCVLDELTKHGNP